MAFAGCGISSYKVSRQLYTMSGLQSYIRCWNGNSVLSRIYLFDVGAYYTMLIKLLIYLRHQGHDSLITSFFAVKMLLTLNTYRKSMGSSRVDTQDFLKKRPPFMEIHDTYPLPKQKFIGIGPMGMGGGGIVETTEGAFPLVAVRVKAER